MGNPKVDAFGIVWPEQGLPGLELSPSTAT